MVTILLEVGGDAMMDQPNSAGETPRQLLPEILAIWEKWEVAEIAKKR